MAISRAAFGRGDLDAAVEDLLRLPADLTVRGVLAADLLGALIGSVTTANPHRLRHLDSLLEIAEGSPPDTPEWPMVHAAARMVPMLHGGAEGYIAEPLAVLAKAETFLKSTPSGDDAKLAPMWDAMKTMIGALRAMENGDEAAMERLPDEARRVRETLAADPALATFGDAFANLTDMLT
ncbi:hypothetical protein, partial [Micromonospora parva]